VKVYINGIKVESTGDYSVTSFLSDLAQEQLTTVTHVGRDRAIAAETHGDLTIGVLLSKCDQANFVVWNVDPKNKRFSATVESTSDGRPQTDFTAFAIRRDTGYGVFSQYRGSGGATMLGNVFRKVASPFAKRHADNLISEAVQCSEDVQTKEFRQRIASVSNSHISAILMPRDSEFAETIQKFRKLSYFEFVDPRVDEPSLRSFRGCISKKRKKLYLTEGRPIADLRNAIASFVTDQGITEGSVNGKLSDDTDGGFTLTIHQDVYCFEKYDFDETVCQETFESPGLAKSPLIKKMLATIRSNKGLFASGQ
jgi:hypothetical protein